MINGNQQKYRLRATEMRQRYRDGQSIRQIALSFGMTLKSVKSILREQVWREN